MLTQEVPDAAHKIWNGALPDKGAFDKIFLLRKTELPRRPDLWRHVCVMAADLGAQTLKLFESLQVEEDASDRGALKAAQTFIIHVFGIRCHPQFISLSKQCAKTDFFSCGIYCIMFGRTTCFTAKNFMNNTMISCARIHFLRSSH